MTRTDYLAAVLRIFLDPPGAPKRASRSDWATAQTLHARGVHLDHFAHAVRLATLRRLDAQRTQPPVRCLAYYRHVLEQLRPDELDPGYVLYIAQRYADLDTKSARSDRQNRALSDRR